MDNTINFQELFEGFQNTPFLWKTPAMIDLEQFCPKSTKTKFIQESEPKKLRLGKWVEHFVSFQLQQDARNKILEENLQIKDNKITIGELDLLLLQDEQPIHLEIIYKFYLFDSSIHQTNSLYNWVGPNQNDTLVYKLTKLKEKQLPLLYHPETKAILKDYPFQINSIEQKVCFKAQLFLPYEDQHIDISPLNANCVMGWYLNIENIDDLKHFQFHITEKLEWLSSPHIKVDWLSFDDAKHKIRAQIDNKRSPLCWLKKNTNELQKCFITWW